MKNLTTYALLLVLGTISLSSCTMGDKGSAKVPDSVKIDTVIRPKAPEEKQSDTTLIDSLQTDTVKKPKK